MAIFSKIKKILENQDACVLSKSGTPQYVIMKWDAFQKVSARKDELEKLQSQVEAERNEEADFEVIDINKIPV